jgi:hypothetical protein
MKEKTKFWKFAHSKEKHFNPKRKTARTKCFSSAITNQIILAEEDPKDNLPFCELLKTGTNLNISRLFSFSSRISFVQVLRM